VVVYEYAVGTRLGVKDKCEEHNVENHIEKLIRDGARRERATKSQCQYTSEVRRYGEMRKVSLELPTLGYHFCRVRSLLHRVQRS
jgi:hypothetical protein